MSRSNPRRADAPRSSKAAALGTFLLCVLCFAGCQQADRANEAPQSVAAPTPTASVVESATTTSPTTGRSMAVAGASANGEAVPTDGPSGYAPAVEKPSAPMPIQPAQGEVNRWADTANLGGDLGWKEAPPPPPAVAQMQPQEHNERARLADPQAPRLGDGINAGTATLDLAKTGKKDKVWQQRGPGATADQAEAEPEAPAEKVTADEEEKVRDEDSEDFDDVADKSVTKSRSRIAGNLEIQADDAVFNDAEDERKLKGREQAMVFGSKGKPKRQKAQKGGLFRETNKDAERGETSKVEGGPENGLEDGYLARVDDGKDDEVRPTEFLPRTCYVSNTYLGNRAAHVAALSALDARLSPAERPYAQAGLPPQAFDGPDNVGISLSTRLDRAWLDTPGRVYLQVGLRGSDRHGWRRPPLDLVLVLDAAVANNEAQVLALTTGLMRRLGPQDRLGVLVAGGDAPQILSPVDTLRAVRPVLTHTLGEGPLKTQAGDGVALAAGLARAGELLDAAAEGQARVPGTQVVLLAVSGDAQRTEAARIAAHQLTLQGAVVSVAALDGAAEWWTVADAGHGSLHRGPQVEAHLDAELEGLSRVVARLLRLDIKLGENVNAVRVLGAEVLGAREVARVKAREEAVDARLAKTTGLKADRGDDGEGIQIVVPWFAGGDSHVVLVELWVDEPGPVAEVTLKYKDMVALSNGTARSSVALPRTPHNLTASQHGVRRNVAGFKVAEALQGASLAAARGASAHAKALLRQALPPNPTDRAVVLGFLELLDRRPAPLVAEALQVAAERRYGAPADETRP